MTQQAPASTQIGTQTGTQARIATQIDADALRAFQAKLHGRAILPGDEEYDEARKVWNGMIDKYPAIIARCATPADVAAAIAFARAQRLIVSVRGGGHNVAGHAVNDGGLVIDLSPMKQIDVNPQERIASAGGGVTWGELDAATQVYCLATPGGVFTRTGIAGLTLGGGYGWLRNTYGLSSDNLVSAQVVTADGEIIEVNEREHADLLWGLRGGGGNFGVVTRFDFRLHPVGPEVMFVFAFHDARGDKMKQALQLYRDFSASAPDEVNTLAACGMIPPDPHAFPAEIHNVPFVLLGGLYAGPVEEGKKALQPLLDFGEPLADVSGVRPYVEAQQAFEADYPDGHRYYWKSLNLLSLDDEVIDRIVAHARRQVSAHSTIDVWHVGGAMKRLGQNSAFHGRHAAVLLGVEANWANPADDDANIRWAREIIDDMQEFSDGSRYLNFAGFQEEGDTMMRGAFGPNYARLAALKQKYDPGNFFNLNQNVKPAANA